MKSMRSVFTLLVVFCLAIVFMAADSYDNTVSCAEGEFDVTYLGSTSFSAGATDNHYTQAMYIGDCNYYDAFFAGWTDAVANDDVNIYVQYSMDRETWKLSTANSGQIIDDLHDGTVQADTINVYGGTRDVLYNSARWMRLYFDGQSGNTTAVDVTWMVHLTKTVQGKSYTGGRVRNRIS